MYFSCLLMLSSSRIQQLPPYEHTLGVISWEGYESRVALSNTFSVGHICSLGRQELQWQQA